MSIDQTMSSIAQSVKPDPGTERQEFSDILKAMSAYN